MEKRAYVTRGEADRRPLRGHSHPAPGQLDIELTERCNNACIHCSINRPAGDARSRSREIGTDAWKDILNQAAALGVLTVRFTGGEPLLRGDFSELYLYARRMGMRVMLFTNAVLVTPQIAAMLADVPPLEAIEVSVYGMVRESYEAVTGVAGSYAAFRHGVQLLLDRKIPFVVKGALLPPNKRETAVFEAWAGTLPRMGGPPAYAMFLDLRGRRDSAAGNRRIRRLRISPEEGLGILTRDPDHYRKEMSEFFDKFSAPPGDRLFTCGIGPACVDAYGVLQPCLSLRHPGLAFDLKKIALADAFTSGWPRLKEMRATHPLYLERCARCFLRGFCEQCPAKSWAEHGTLDTPVEYFCSVAHAQARFLGLVGMKERAWAVRDGRERIRNLINRA